ncbi:putative CxxxxCH...CXXCH cytochrome family protein [Labrenzia sp. EL_208]|nr:putative CxxxxCH...CXXCH cytochrome family protein [Labrenzia sp. EL_132]MBG6227990.1 putative CxxxxCH...CXXCH cytochrome family protein [Labrenzia sp. EL_208]
MIALMRVAVVFLVTGLGMPYAFGQNVDTTEYAGSKTCFGCHETEALAWQRSHHAQAWANPSDQTVDGDFDNTEFTHRGRKSRFFRKENGFFIETEDYNGPPKTFEVKGVGGLAPLQQYLIETEPGRIQSFDVVWDQEKKEWYHLYPEQQLLPEDGFHWSGPYKNWNARCAECHSTGFTKNYSFPDKRYQSDWAEIGVGCEACHGPGAAHVAWAEQSKPNKENLTSELKENGLLIEFTDKKAEIEIQQCAGCHSRREPFQNASPVPGTPFHDTYRLALLRDGLYHADGQILDEVYVFGSFLQSKMYQNGVRCSDCHEPHSGELRAVGNSICSQCHSPTGNEAFPTLTLKDYDDPAHHFHKTGSEGARCVSCHMIERTYMGIDGRRDHSFRIPRPDISAKIGTPNACTDCHQDRTADWAANEIELRFPASTRREDHFGLLFASARRGSTGLGEDLLSVARQETYPAIVRATALDLLTREANPELANQVGEFLNDPDPLVRRAAVSALQHASSEIRAKNIVSALDDPTKTVRIAAARQLLGLPRGQLPPGASASAREATREWQQSLAAKSDFPETHMALGGAALAMRNPAAAISAFEEVVSLDPQLIQAWEFLVRLHLAQQNFAAAEFTLQKALASNPEDQNLLELKNRFPRQ